LPVLETTTSAKLITPPIKENKTKYAQYFTPEVVASYMVGMFDWADIKITRVLDPGAGEGALAFQMLNYLKTTNEEPPVYMVEIDPVVYQELKTRSKKFESSLPLRLIHGDFIYESFKLMQQDIRFSHIVINPPYYKMQRGSTYSEYLLKRGVNATNIYAAFVWLAAMLLEENGQLVAIIPRSFCNGPYFLKFREYIANNLSIDAIHIFDSRDSVFSKDKVLQENIIIKLSKRSQSDSVRITYSVDHNFADVKELQVKASQVLSSQATGYCIHIPTQANELDISRYATHTLREIDLSVSTGPVVSFRQSDSISHESSGTNVPLLFPGHMDNGVITWPVANLPKRGQYYEPEANLWNAVNQDVVGDKNISPSDGYYVIIRRFSSKEEKRRINVSVVDAPMLNSHGVAFENSLNYFHRNKHGFEKESAYGLAAYLSSEVVDAYFRTFSGHTQVNATDLKNIPYPSMKQLTAIGSSLIDGKRSCKDILSSELLEVYA
jgi:adenine-specific DNA-methyltransferase